MSYVELVKALFDEASSCFAAYLEAKQRYGEDDPLTLVNYYACLAIVDFLCDSRFDLSFFASDNPTLI